MKNIFAWVLKALWNPYGNLYCFCPLERGINPGESQNIYLNCDFLYFLFREIY